MCISYKYNDTNVSYTNTIHMIYRTLQALLGDSTSRRSLRQAVHHFVSLRRYEQMSVHQAMQGIKLSTLSALQPNNQPGAQAGHRLGTVEL